MRKKKRLIVFLIGILLENAGNIVLNKALDTNKYPTIYNSNYNGLKTSLERMAKAGITGLVDARYFGIAGQTLKKQQKGHN